MSIIFLIAWLVSAVGTVLLGAVAITYIRRTWQLIRAEEDDPTRERLLDGLDHLENQMHLVAERLGSLEERLEGMEKRLEDGSRTRLPPPADAGPAEEQPRNTDPEPEPPPRDDHPQSADGRS